MSAQPAVFITMPKYVAITPVQAVTTIGTTTTSLPKIRPAPAEINATIDTTTETNEAGADSTAPRGKKRRLDHLSWEEKVQRKKLKNRVAAQTSRDRKKARMEEMEIELQDLTERTEILINKCESLQVINDSLLEKNQKLDMEVELLRQQLQELQKQQQLQSQQQLQQQQQMVDTCAGCESLLNGSAVSNNTDPLPQGSNPKDSQSSQETITVLKLKQKLEKSATVSSLWRVIALCLLYKICCYPTSKSTKERSMMQSLMPESWKNLPKACLPTSPQTWKQAIERAMRLLPKLQAEQSDSLDQWWGPQQSAWNPANIKQATMAAA